MTSTDQLPAALQGAALIDIKTVRTLTGFKSSDSIYVRLRRGEFPQPVRLSSRCTRWRCGDVLHWIDTQKAAHA